jgi:hypothetical protein
VFLLGYWLDEMSANHFNTFAFADAAATMQNAIRMVEREGHPDEVVAMDIDPIDEPGSVPSSQPMNQPVVGPSGQVNQHAHQANQPPIQRNQPNVGPSNQSVNQPTRPPTAVDVRRQKLYAIGKQNLEKMAYKNVPTDPVRFNGLVKEMNSLQISRETQKRRNADEILLEMSNHITKLSDVGFRYNTPELLRMQKKTAKLQVEKQVLENRLKKIKQESDELETAAKLFDGIDELARTACRDKNRFQADDLRLSLLMNAFDGDLNCPLSMLNTACKRVKRQ